VIIAQITLSDRAHDPLHAALQGEPRAAPAVWTLFVATAAACSLLLLGVLVAAVFVAYRAAGRQGTRSVRAVQGRVHLAAVQRPQPHFCPPSHCRSSRTNGFTQVRRNIEDSRSQEMRLNQTA
jgi:hypothetical protein